jgi:hypothetical protein
VHAVALAAEPYFAALARDTDDEETRGYIEIGVRMFRDLANWTDPTEHRIRDVVLRQASCTDLSWAGGSRYLLLQAIRESLLEPGPVDASAVEARLMLRLGPVLGFECPPRTGMLKKAVPLPRSMPADPPPVLSTFRLLAFARDWTMAGLNDHPLRNAVAAFDERIAGDLAGRRFPLSDGRTARLEKGKVILE